MSSANYRKNSIYALLAKASGAVAALLTTMILTRALPETEFGSYVLAYTFVFLGCILGSMGMGNAVLRYGGAFIGAGRPSAARQVALKCTIVGAVSLAVLSLLVVALHPVASRAFDAWPDGLLNATLIGIWMFGAGAILLLTSVIRAFGRIGTGAVAEVTIPRVVLLVTMAVLFFLHVDQLSSMLAAAAVVNLLAALWAFVTLMRVLPEPDQQENMEGIPSTGAIFDFALPLLGSNVLFQLMTDATLFMVATYCGREDVALYGAAYRIWGFLGLPQNSVSSAIQGRIAELHSAHEKQQLEELVRNSANLATLPTLLVTGVVCVAAGPLLALLFGDFYAGGHAALVVLCLGQLGFVVLGPSEHLLAMSGYQRIVLVATMLAAMLAVAAAWILTPYFGIVGAAIAAAVATIAFKLLLAWQAWQQMGIRPWVNLSPRCNASPASILATATESQE